MIRYRSAGAERGVICPVIQAPRFLPQRSSAFLEPWILCIHPADEERMCAKDLRKVLGVRLSLCSMYHFHLHSTDQNLVSQLHLGKMRLRNVVYWWPQKERKQNCCVSSKSLPQCIISFNSQDNSMKQILFLFQFCRRANWGSEKKVLST